MRAYGDGTAKGEKLTVTTERSGGRTFILTVGPGGGRQERVVVHARGQCSS